MRLGTLDSQQTWQRDSGVAALPDGVDRVRLELRLVDAPPGTVADVDELR